MHSRFATLALTMLASACIQFDWLIFAPVTSAAAAHYHVSADAVGLFSLSFAVLFLPLGLPAGWFIDRFGVRTSLWLAGALLAAGALLRAFDAFGPALAGQVVLAISQPIVMSLVSPLATTRHPEREQLPVTAACTMSLFTGIALAFVIVPSASAAFGIPVMLAGVALVHVVLAVAVLAVVDADPARPVTVRFEKRSIAMLFRDRAFIVVLGVMLLGNGYFNGLLTWLEQILRVQGIDAVHAGYVGLAIILGGVAGSVAVPLVAGRIGGIRVAAMLAIAAALVLSPIATLSASMAVLIGAAALLGFMLLGPVPLFIDLVAGIAGPQRAGFALATLWVAANAGGAAVIVLLPAIAHQNDWRPAVWALEAVLAAELAVLPFLRVAVAPAIQAIPASSFGPREALHLVGDAAAAGAGRPEGGGERGAADGASPPGP